jgi:hypothetical protein
LNDDIERRRHPRSAYIRTLEYTRSTTMGDVFLCMSVDISDSGMCVYSSDPLDEGEDIEFKDALRVPQRKACVRWVRKYSRDFFRVGLTFRNNF